MKLKNYSPKHIQNLSRDEAHINLFSEIGGEGIQGQSFADEITMLNDFGVETINIHLASDGGSVSDGLIIFSAINNSEAHVNIFIEGVAASMGAVIAMAGDRIHMSDISQLMIHNPHGGDPDDENTQKALEALRESLLKAINNRATISEAKISKMMNEETWISPVEALEMGLIDEIIKTKKHKKQSKAAIMDILNKYSNNKTNDMKNIATHFGLKEDASEAAILEAAKSVSTDLETRTNELKEANETIEASAKEVTELKATIETFESKAVEVEDTIVKETIAEGIKKGVFKEDAKEDLTAQFKGDSTGLKSIMNSLSGKAPDIAGQLNGKKPAGESKLSKELQEMDWRTLDKAGKLETVKGISEVEYFAKYREFYNGKEHPDFVPAV